MKPNEVIEDLATITIAGIIGAAGLAGLAILYGLLLALPIWLCWNFVMPDLFNFPEITLLQALNLSILGNCLFNHGSSTTTTKTTKK